MNKTSRPILVAGCFSKSFGVFTRVPNHTREVLTHGPRGRPPTELRLLEAPQDEEDEEFVEEVKPKPKPKLIAWASVPKGGGAVGFSL